MWLALSQSVQFSSCEHVVFWRQYASVLLAILQGLFVLVIVYMSCVYASMSLFLACQVYACSYYHY